ncbi:MULTISPECIES: hypothetical protein [unclassified Saccharicrinis]|uniref:hypothetical protein n=1 Tax=unclassified Saccharicrinis TaxID=2646859 RepID=UPI003D333875
METYNVQNKQPGNQSDDLMANYNRKLNKEIHLIYDRLIQLKRELEMDHLTPKVREYHHVRIDELQTLLNLLGM